MTIGCSSNGWNGRVWAQGAALAAVAALVQAGGWGRDAALAATAICFGGDPSLQWTAALGRNIRNVTVQSLADKSVIIVHAQHITD